MPHLSSNPQHIAIIMDGNGRWAKSRLLPRLAGHKAGLDAVRRTIEWCSKKQISVLTLFAFSSENWGRPAKEVSGLMELFLQAFKTELQSLHQNNVQVRFIGYFEPLSQKLKNWITDAWSLTKNNTGLKLVIAINYGGRWDITQAVQKIMQTDIDYQNITSELIAEHLSLADLPDPDLLIRTSGEMRISNFLLWQLAYTELYFTKTLWPDMAEKDLELALTNYLTKQRRFGKAPEQLT